MVLCGSGIGTPLDHGDRLEWSNWTRPLTRRIGVPQNTRSDIQFMPMGGFGLAKTKAGSGTCRLASRFLDFNGFNKVFWVNGIEKLPDSLLVTSQHELANVTPD